MLLLFVFVGFIYSQESVRKFGQTSKMQTTMDTFEYNWKTPNESAKSSQQEPEQGAASVYFASEEEAIGVEQLLAEPEYDDIVNTLLDFNTCTFSVPESYFKEFSASESVLTKSDCDAVQRGLSEEDKTREKVLDGLSNGYDENHCFISCEDYLLEETPNLHDITRDISCVGNVDLKNQLADSDGRNYGVRVLKLFDAIAGNQWMKPHTIFGLENQEMSDKNSSPQKCSLDLRESQGAKIPQASYENLLTATTAFASIFTFRRKLRVQHVKRREHIQWNSFKCLSSAAGEIQIDFPDEGNSKESSEENVKCDGMKFAISEQYLKCKPSRGRFGRQYYHRGARVSSQGLGKRNSQVGCDQIPHDLPIEDYAHDDNIHSAEAQDDPFGTLSDMSSDNTSEDDCTIGSKTRGVYRDRKHSKFWSICEVLKLVEGVSEYGVGRWSDIKKIFFQSSVRHSPADLKDKWRNLLRASCRRLQNQRGVDARKKHGAPSIPHDLLKRVRELAVIYPYSRKRRSRI
ncbi:unnamed protein product [Withania somnifera]